MLERWNLALVPRAADAHPGTLWFTVLVYVWSPEIHSPCLCPNHSGQTGLSSTLWIQQDLEACSIRIHASIILLLRDPHASTLAMRYRFPVSKGLMFLHPRQWETKSEPPFWSNLLSGSLFGTASILPAVFLPEKVIPYPVKWDEKNLVLWERLVKEGVNGAVCCFRWQHLLLCKWEAPFWALDPVGRI